MQSQKFTQASDVWSFGVVCAEIFQDGATPYGDNTSLENVIYSVGRGDRIARDDIGCSEHVYRLLLLCWQGEAAQRPTFAQLIVHFGELQHMQEELMYQASAKTAARVQGLALAELAAFYPDAMPYGQQAAKLHPTGGLIGATRMMPDGTTRVQRTSGWEAECVEARIQEFRRPSAEPKLYGEHLPDMPPKGLVECYFNSIWLLIYLLQVHREYVS